MFKNSLAIHQNLESKKGMAIVYGKLGEVYYIRRDLNRAEDMFKKSLEIDELLNNKKSMATAYGYLGDIYRLRLDLKQAEDMYEKGLKLFEAAGSERMIEIMRQMLTNLRNRKEQS